MTIYNFDPTHSNVEFSVRHMVIAKVRGRFGSWSGKLHLDPERPETGKVEVTLEAASIDTGVTDRDNHLKSADFFDVDQYPELRFESTKVEAAGKNKYRVLGDLTIRDVTRKIVLDVDYAGQAKDPWGNQRVAFSASTSINRGDFGLKWNQALEAGGVLVGERVDIELEVQAVEQAASASAAE